MYRKLSIVLLIGSFIISGITGCGKKIAEKGAPVKIRVAFWGAVEEKEIITKTIREWEKGNPNIKVMLEHIPASYTDKILTEIAGGNPPDIVFCEVNVFVTFFYKNAFLDLTPFIETDEDINIKDFFPEVLARFTRNGKIFCIPRDTAPFACIYYNKSLFRKLNIPYPKDSWDMNKFLRTAKKLTIDENGKHPGEKGFNPKKIKRYGFWGWAWQNFIYSFGGRLVDDINNPTECLINEKGGIDGIQFFVDLSHKHHVSPRPDALANMGMGINQLFSMEKLAMYQSGIWDTPGLRRIIGERFEWDVAMFPKGPNGKRGFGTGGSGYTIMKSCKHPREAWEVLKCLAGDAGQEMLADTGLAQPANRKIAEGSHWAGNPNPPLNKKMLNEAVKYVTYDPFHPHWREAWDKYANPQLDLIVNNRITVKQGLDKIVKRVNGMLQEKD